MERRGQAGICRQEHPAVEKVAEQEARDSQRSMPPREVGVIASLDEKGTLLLVWINSRVASKRTRKRVKECGPLFEFIRNETRDGEILLRSEKTGWFGWLPLSEIVTQPVAGRQDRTTIKKEDE